MSVFISHIDAVSLYLTWTWLNLAFNFFTGQEPLAQCAVSLKHWFQCKRLWVVAYKSLKTKENSSWVIRKMDAIPNENFSGTKSEFKRGFTKVVVTRAGRLWATLVPWRAATVSVRNDAIFVYCLTSRWLYIISSQLRVHAISVCWFKGKNVQ